MCDMLYQICLHAFVIFVGYNRYMNVHFIHNITSAGYMKENMVMSQTCKENIWLQHQHTVKKFKNCDLTYIYLYDHYIT